MSNALFYRMHTKALSQRNWLSLCTVAVELVSLALIVCLSVCSGSKTLQKVHSYFQVACIFGDLRRSFFAIV